MPDSIPEVHVAWRWVWYGRPLLALGSYSLLLLLKLRLITTRQALVWGGALYAFCLRMRINDGPWERCDLRLCRHG